MAWISVDLQPRQLKFYQQGRGVRTYPVAIGKSSTPTPLGIFMIERKEIEPGGILGSRLLKLNSGGLAIHGTADPSSIGRAVSNGCIRMHNHHIEEIYPEISLGTKVEIIRSEALPDDVYIVYPGDNLWNIAKRYGVSPEEIAALNKLSDPSLIFPGQKLMIPQY